MHFLIEHLNWYLLRKKDVLESDGNEHTPTVTQFSKVQHICDMKGLAHESCFHDNSNAQVGVPNADCSPLLMNSSLSKEANVTEATRSGEDSSHPAIKAACLTVQCRCRQSKSMLRNWQIDPWNKDSVTKRETRNLTEGSWMRLVTSNSSFVRPMICSLHLTQLKLPFGSPLALACRAILENNGQVRLWHHEQHESVGPDR